MKKISSVIGALGLSSVVAGQVAHAHDDSASRLTVRTSDECLLLENKNCSGTRHQIQYSSPSGYFLSVEKMGDHAAYTAFDKSYAFKNIAEAHAEAWWTRNISGYIGRFGKAFHTSENSTLQIEAYIGHVAGNVHVRAEANAKLHPQTITTPAISHGGYSIPSQTYQFKGLQTNIKPFDYAVAAKTYYGGLRQHFGTSWAATNHFHVLVNQSAQFGFERKSYGAGLGFAYTSEQDDKLGAKFAGICQRGDIHSKARYTFAIAACTEKVKQDLLYDKMNEKAVEWADKINHRIGIGQAAIDRVTQRIGSGHSYNLPTVTGDHVMQFLDIPSPYRHLNTSFVVAASMHISGAHITLSRTQPLKSSLHGMAITSLSVGYDF